MLAAKLKCLELERERVKSLVIEVELVRNDAIEGKGKVERLSGQVEDLKRLIDEFRVKVSLRGIFVFLVGFWNWMIIIFDFRRMIIFG